MKIDSRSLVIGLAIGVVIGSFVLFVWTGSPQIISPEQYNVRMKIGVVSSGKWVSINQNGVTVAIVADDLNQHYTEVGAFSVGSAWKDIALRKGAYTCIVYEGKSGLFIVQFQIYVSKDIEVEIPI